MSALLRLLGLAAVIALLGRIFLLPKGVLAPSAPGKGGAKVTADDGEGVPPGAIEKKNQNLPTDVNVADGPSNAKASARSFKTLDGEANAERSSGGTRKAVSTSDSSAETALSLTAQRNLKLQLITDFTGHIHSGQATIKVSAKITGAGGTITLDAAYTLKENPNDNTKLDITGTTSKTIDNAARTSITEDSKQAVALAKGNYTLTFSLAISSESERSADVLVHLAEVKWT